MATGTLNYGLFALPMQSELGLSRVMFGWMQTTRRLSAGALSFAVGWLIDRYGPRVYLPVAALLIEGCLILVGMSNHFGQRRPARREPHRNAIDMPPGGTVTIAEIPSS